MKHKIAFLVHTEYHLLLALHHCKENYTDLNKYEVHLLLKRNGKSNRLKQDLDTSFLPYKVVFLDFSIQLKGRLSETEKETLEELRGREYHQFNFFQEQDPISLLLIEQYKKKGTQINLFQDGLKPYIAHSMRFSPDLIRTNIRQNLWIRRNGYPVNDYFSFFNCKQYGFVKGIDRLFLTFPEAYINWNKLSISTMDLTIDSDFLLVLRQLFHWEDALLSVRKNVIFFMNQPMHDDGSFEVKALQKLRIKFPDSKIYIKNHPLTSDVKRKAYLELNDVEIIDSKIPAELFIAHLENSLILSVCSTSMFIDNPKCKFYYMFAIQEDNNIERLKKYNVINPTKHVITATTLKEIAF